MSVLHGHEHFDCPAMGIAIAAIRNDMNSFSFIYFLTILGICVQSYSFFRKPPNISPKTFSYKDILDK